MSDFAKDTNVHTNDYISRQAAIDELRKAENHAFNLYYKGLIKAHKIIADLPSVQPDNDCENCVFAPFKQFRQKWIHCSERLPEYGVAVLTYDGSCYYVEKRIPTIRGDNGEPISGDWWVSDDYDESYRYYPNLRDGACIAWMPLPEPYSPGCTDDACDIGGE